MDSANSPPSQSLQAHSSPDSPPTSPARGFPTYFYKRSGQHVILWRDITRVFNNAQYVSHNGLLVPFLTDDDLNKLPQEMILYHPGVTLRVIVPMRAGHDQVGSTTHSSLSTGQHISIDTARGTLFPSTNIAIGTELQSSDVAYIDIDPSMHKDYIEHRRSPTLASASENQSTVQAHLIHTREDFCNPSVAAPSEAKYERLVIEESERQRFEGKQRAQEKDTELVEVIHDLSREVHAMRQQLQDLSRHALEHFAAEENRAQILTTQDYEMHEYPVPRLFIILPTEGRKRDFARNWVFKTYRLYFLCECGAHTGYETDGSPHQIHLASHDGYDIAKQSDFAREYGSHLLKILKMVKFSLIAAEAAVPALQHFNAVQGLERIASLLKSTSKTFSALLDESISFVKGHLVNYNDIVDEPACPVNLDNLPSLEGPQLRQLESFLSLNDQSRVLGNLYRIATKRGHIKWVCKDHRQGISPPSAIKELQTFTTTNKGTFIEEEGMVGVSLASKAQAEEFYGLMVRAKCVHELRIALEWRVTTHHLQDLYDAVTDSNIIRMELSGCGEADSTSEIDGSLFRPLLDLMLNGKIQIMVLKRVCHRDFLYVNESGMGITTRLRELTFKDLSTLDNGRIPTLPRILEFCPSLTTLSIKSEFAHDILSWIRRDPSRFLRLKTLVVHETGRRHYHLVVGLSKGQIKSIEVMRLSSRSWNADGIHELLSCGYITKLRVLLDVAGAHGDRCMDILRCNPNVDEFHLSIPELSASAVDWAISSMREFHAKQQSIPQNQIKINCDTYPDVVSCTLDFNKDSQTVSVSTHIQLVSQRCNMDNLVALVGKYGWSVTRLDFRDHFSSEFALALDSSVRKSGSSLKRLLLDPARLVSLEDFACVDRILGHSKDLSTLSAVLRMDDINWKEGARWLFGTHGEIVTALMLEGAKGVIWNRELAKLFPSRSELKKLEELSLRGVDTELDAMSFAHWVTGMISNPFPTQVYCGGFFHSRSTRDASGLVKQAYLKNIELESIILRKDQWTAIFEAIDCTALERLRLFNNRLTPKQLDCLIQCILKSAKDDKMLPLRELNIGNNVDLVPCYVSDEALATLRKKAPQVQLSRDKHK
ncbi:hypothetical protein BGZ98_009938 [Dissophora globulifera]|nr:hypothetical protein BGZ98_009938 [Dissophora globulifera]